MEISAVIVARAGSKRIGNKAMLELGGETLISRKINQLKKATLVDRIIFGSDSEEMLEEAYRSGAEVIKRPEYYCDEEKASANEMIKNMCTLVRTDVIMWAHCTNPLISSQTYDRAIETFLNNKKYDSLLSVKTFQEHLWSPDKLPVNYNPYGERHVAARGLPKYYIQDGGIFIQRHEQMLKNSYFFGKAPYLFVIPEDEFLDINEIKDYYLAKVIIDHELERNNVYVKE